jgi:hypothetical protein
VCERWETLPSGIDRCARPWFLPVGGLAGEGLGEPTTRQPKGAMQQADARQQGRSVKQEDLKAPPVGFTATRVMTDPGGESRFMRPIGKVPGVRCTRGDGGGMTWPTLNAMDWEFRAQPASVKWVLHDPPLLAAEGPTINPIGQKGRDTLFFRDCGPEPLRAARLLGGGLWLEEVEGAEDTVWIVRFRALELGRVPGSQFQFAARPLP